ncbi:MAG: glycosyltransferase involved in cell wall biosynthesis [Cellvibrionaceae bacterium]|jgi:glycosyltransferase involved in cell wall biosynthesis
MNYCFVVPHFNHHLALAKFLPILSSLSIPCVVVDDGSDSESVTAVEALLERVAEEGNDNYFLKHAFNRGKGAAVFTGAYYARTLGFTHIIQIDADGQHDINDVAGFLDYSRAHADAIVSGKPYFDASAPKLRVYGRRVTDLWVALETLSFQIKDGLCGFRIYPLSQVEKILDRYHIGIRMDFDTEILVKAVWADVPLHFMPTKVIYPENSVSHFHYARDNLLLIALHARLILGMLLRSPMLIARRIRALLAAKGDK